MYVGFLDIFLSPFSFFLQQLIRNVSEVASVLMFVALMLWGLEGEQKYERRIRVPV